MVPVEKIDEWATYARIEAYAVGVDTNCVEHQQLCELNGKGRHGCCSHGKLLRLIELGPIAMGSEDSWTSWRARRQLVDGVFEVVVAFRWGRKDRIRRRKR